MRTSCAAGGVCQREPIGLLSLLGQTSIAILAVMSCRTLIHPILRVFCQVPEYLPRSSVGSAEFGLGGAMVDRWLPGANLSGQNYSQAHVARI